MLASASHFLRVYLVAIGNFARATKAFGVLWLCVEGLMFRVEAVGALPLWGLRAPAGMGPPKTAQPETPATTRTR